ncbi:MAG: alpha/beta fold hydrolase [Actinomycetota bacterium]
MSDKGRIRPASLVLVHGAASGPWVFDRWIPAFPKLTTVAPDLQAGLDVATATMSDYASAVAVAARGLPQPLVLCGWSMGGLVALLAAADVSPDELVLLEPSPPGEIAGFHPEVELHTGVYEGEVFYGPFPSGVRSRPESALAQTERWRGISVRNITCRSLVVYGDEFRENRGRAVAAFYGSDELYFPGLGPGVAGH